jgi:hypothetical protein
MKGRMKKRADGGAVEVEDAGGNKKVMNEAKERKRGGKVMKEEKMAGKMHGEMSRHRLDRPGRKRGGRVGADMNPLSSAHNTTGAGPDN